MSHPEVVDAATAVLGGPTKIDELNALVVPLPGCASNEDWLSDLRSFLHAKLGRKKLPTRLQACTSIKRSAAGKVPREWLLQVMNDA